MNMNSPAKSDRKTVVIRVPRKYRYLITAFGMFLKDHLDQATLWECEEYLSQKIEEQKTLCRGNSPGYQVNVAAAFWTAMKHLESKKKKTAS